jgi:hypothetical protein
MSNSKLGYIAGKPYSYCLVGKRISLPLSIYPQNIHGGQWSFINLQLPQITQEYQPWLHIHPYALITNYKTWTVEVPNLSKVEMYMLLRV